MRIELNVKGKQTFLSGLIVTKHKQALTCALKVKRGGGFDRAVYGCNHTQTLADRSEEVRLKEINEAIAYEAARIERASRPTEEFDLQIGRLVNEFSQGRPDKHLWSPAARSFDPPHNNLEKVVVYIRQVAAELFQARDVRVEFNAPPDSEQINLTTEQCQHLVLILEEALQNIAAHAHCTTVYLAASVKGRRLEVKIHDDGSSLIGKLLSQPAILRQKGGGLRDMQMQVAKLGWALEIATAPGWGTRLTLMLPLHI